MFIIAFYILCQYQITQSKQIFTMSKILVLINLHLYYLSVPSYIIMLKSDETIYIYNINHLSRYTIFIDSLSGY